MLANQSAPLPLPFPQQKQVTAEEGGLVSPQTPHFHDSVPSGRLAGWPTAEAFPGAISKTTLGCCRRCCPDEAAGLSSADRCG